MKVPPIIFVCFTIKLRLQKNYFNQNIFNVSNKVLSIQILLFYAKSFDFGCLLNSGKRHSSSKRKFLTFSTKVKALKQSHPMSISLYCDTLSDWVLGWNNRKWIPLSHTHTNTRTHVLSLSLSLFYL